MTWYFWVWGILSTVAILTLFIGLIIGIAYLLEIKKNGIAELNLQITHLEKRVALRDEKIKKYVAQIEEMRKDQNEFGRISP
jgi:hypothetical protein